MPRGPANAFYRRYGKRSIDLAVSIASMPVVVLAAVVVVPLIKLEDGGPAIYQTTRIGLGQQPFTMYKFRSMSVGAPDLRNEDGSTLNSDNDKRVTRVGRFIRKTSIDELPQLVNVILGQMSLVGPRPNMFPSTPRQLDPDEVKRLEVRPGITGLAQATGRNSLTVEQKREIDCHYVDEVSISIDISVLLKTAVTVFQRRGINAKESA